MSKELRRKRELQGVCIYCGCRPPEFGRKGCLTCLKNKVLNNNAFSKRNPIKVKLYKSKIKHGVIEKYGGSCECCGEKALEFLVIDHKNNDGGKERKALYGKNKGHSYSWYLKLKRESLRDDLRVLCHNCNMAIAFYGYCPHKGRPVNEMPTVITDNEFKILCFIGMNIVKITEVCSDKSLSGIFGSLVKKKFIYCEENNCKLTKAGLLLYETKKEGQ